MARLKEIIGTASGAGICENREVERIVNQFVNLTFGEMTCMDADYREIYSLLLPSVGVEEPPDELSYPEFITLIDNWENTDYAKENSPKGVYRYFPLLQMEFLKKIVGSANDSIHVQMFASLEVKAFYHYLESRHNNKVALEAYKKLISGVEEYTNSKVEENISIRDLLKKIEKAMAVSWSPWSRTIEEFEQYVLRGYGMLKDILIGSFQIGYRERCHTNDVIAGIKKRRKNYGEYFV